VKHQQAVKAKTKRKKKIGTRIIILFSIKKDEEHFMTAIAMFNFLLMQHNIKNAKNPQVIPPIPIYKEILSSES